LPRDEMPELKRKVNELYPYEVFIKKHKSPTLVRDIVDFDDN
jgi:hypothetical protein